VEHAPQLQKQVLCTLIWKPHLLKHKITQPAPAACRGVRLPAVLRTSSFLSGSPPLRSKSFTTIAWPSAAARCNAVRPSCRCDSHQLHTRTQAQP
jgi:hypothetical protein